LISEAKSAQQRIAADATPYSFNNVIAPAKVSAFQACLANDGEAAQLKFIVGGLLTSMRRICR